MKTPSTQADILPQTLDTSEFRPNADGHEIDFTPLGGGDNYVEVDEVISDEDTTYVSIAKANQEDYYDITDHGAEDGEISNLQILVRAKQTGAENIQICLFTIATEYCSANKQPNAGYGDLTNDWATNPNTGIAWTWANIDALQIGQKSKATGGWGGTLTVTQIYATVTYASAPHTTYFWFGHVDNMWNNAGNWEPTSAADYPKDADDQAYIDDEVRTDITLQAGAATTLTIGELIINSTYTGTITSQLDLVVDSSGAHSGDITLGGGTWNWATNDVNNDGDFLNTGTTIQNPGRYTIQGGQTQSITSNGEAFNEVTVDNVANTIYYMMDDTEIFDLTILAAGTFEIDSVSETANLELSFTDSANCGFVSSSSGRLLLQGDATWSVTITTADGAPPPTNRWAATFTAATFTFDYTTWTYHNTLQESNGIWDIEDSSFSSQTTGYAVSIGSGNTINAFNDNTIGTGTTNGYGFRSYIDYTGFDNIVITTFGAKEELVPWNNANLEFVNSNFNDVLTGRAGSSIISDVHNDVANAYGIWTGTTDILKSSFTNDFASGHDVRYYATGGGKFVMNENGAAKTVRVDSGTTFQIGQDTPTASRTLTFDDAAGAGFDVNSAGLIRGSGSVANEMYITSAATPPTTYWNCNLDVGNPDFTFDYTTLSYGSRCRSSGTWDVDYSTFDNFFNGQYVITFTIGATITSFTHNTISNSGLGLYTRVAHTSYDNIVITMSTTDIRSRDVISEFVNSNFDVTQIDLGNTGNIISDTHDDISNNYKIICTALSKSSITNDFSSSDDIEIVSNGCAFTIDEDAENNNYWAQSNTVTTQDSGTTWTITGNANFTINGTVESSGIITYSGAQWFSFFVNYDAYLYLNTSSVINSDIVISFPFTVGTGNYGAVNELNITQPAGADNAINITQRDFSVKGSGTVLTFIANNSASVTTHYTITNLTTGEAYNVDINGTTVYTIDAASSQIGFSYTSEGDRNIEIIWTANISNTAPTITNPVIEDYAIEGEKYGYEFTATDPEGDTLTWTILTDATFLNIISSDTTATVYGTPRLQQDEGIYWVLITVSDGSLTDSNNYTLRVSRQTNPTSPIEVFTNTEYDSWTNSLKIELWWIQRGGPETAELIKRELIVNIDGNVDIIPVENNFIDVPLPWNYLDGGIHNITVTGAVFINWTTGPSFFLSDMEFMVADNSTRALILYLLITAIVIMGIMAVWELSKRNRNVRSSKSKARR